MPAPWDELLLATSLVNAASTGKDETTAMAKKMHGDTASFIGSRSEGSPCQGRHSFSPHQHYLMGMLEPDFSHRFMMCKAE
jgi:hypothetical protein